MRHTNPPEGTFRIVRKFLWLPKRLRRSFPHGPWQERWLETAPAPEGEIPKQENQP